MTRGNQRDLAREKAAKKDKKAKKGLRSNSSSSTESVNSIPASSDEEAGPPIMLDEVQQIEKTKKKKKVY